jgi:stearoyl-CoA desaturase (Delta-9 desaturase)
MKNLAGMPLENLNMRPPTRKSTGKRILAAPLMSTPAAIKPSPRRAAIWLRNLPFLVMHVACLAMFVISPDVWSLSICGLLYFVRAFAITAGYHRYFAHRSYKTSRLFQFVMAWLGCSAMQKGPLWWAAHHRTHHRHSDVEQDPHSPIARDFWWSHIGWILAADHDDTNWSAIRDWRNYPELRWLNRLHWLPGLTLASLCWLIDGWSGLVWGFLLSTIVLYHATFAVNSFCHLWGTRRYATADASRNNPWIALLIMGEGWHNNHHHYQSSANQGFFWWEIDISYYLLRFLGFLGLIWAIRKPPPHVVAEKI